MICVLLLTSIYLCFTVSCQESVVFCSIRQSRNTHPLRTPNSHARHAGAEFIWWMYVPDIGIFCRLRRYIAEKFHLSQQVYDSEVAETKISAGPSRITRPAELNEIVQSYSDVSLRCFLADLQAPKSSRPLASHVDTDNATAWQRRVEPLLPLLPDILPTAPSYTSQSHTWPPKSATQTKQVQETREVHLF